MFGQVKTRTIPGEGPLVNGKSTAGPFRALHPAALLTAVRASSVCLYASSVD